MIYVSDAEYLDNYRLKILFSDNAQGTVDLEKTIRMDHRAIFKELQDIDKFRRFRVDADTIVWENGLDLAPAYLYSKLKDTKNNDEFFDKMNS